MCKVNVVGSLIFLHDINSFEKKDHFIMNETCNCIAPWKFAAGSNHPITDD